MSLQYFDMGKAGGGVVGSGYKRGEEAGKKSPLTRVGRLTIDLSPAGGEARRSAACVRRPQMGGVHHRS